MTEKKRFAPAELTAFCREMALTAGFCAEEADCLAESLVFAEMRGVSSHGVIRLPQYIARAEAGVLRMGAEMPFTMEQGAVARLDAQNGLGQAAGKKAAQKAEELAGKYGVSFVGVANSNHFGVGAWYTAPSAEKGYIAFNLSNASPAMPPFGAREPLLGTNPLGIAVPRGEGEYPLVLDMALSAVSRGKVRLAALCGEKIPTSWGVDADGNPTDDPNAVLAGTLSPLGGAKGSAMAFIIELLCGALTGSGLLGDTKNVLDTSAPAHTGHVFGCIDIKKFLPPEEFARYAEENIRRIRALTPVGGGEILLTGEPEERRMEESARLGVPLDETVLRKLNELAHRYNRGNLG